MRITTIIKGYLNRRTDKILEELIVVVSDLTNSIVDMSDRQVALERTVKDTLKPYNLGVPMGISLDDWG